MGQSDGKGQRVPVNAHAGWEMMRNASAAHTGGEVEKGAVGGQDL